WYSNQQLRKERDLAFEALQQWKGEYQKKVQELQDTTGRYQEILRAESAKGQEVEGFL
ncbi:hypothetical protein A2U01_0070906, partial [Trifolium medium]|nr:hypothetical protein [Trifolium medium]